MREKQGPRVTRKRFIIGLSAGFAALVAACAPFPLPADVTERRKATPTTKPGSNPPSPADAATTTATHAATQEAQPAFKQAQDWAAVYHYMIYEESPEQKK